MGETVTKCEHDGPTIDFREHLPDCQTKTMCNPYIVCTCEMETVTRCFRCAARLRRDSGSEE